MMDAKGCDHHAQWVQAAKAHDRKESVMASPKDGSPGTMVPPGAPAQSESG